MKSTMSESLPANESENPVDRDVDRRQQKQGCFFAGQSPFSLLLSFGAAKERRRQI